MKKWPKIPDSEGDWTNGKEKGDVVRVFHSSGFGWYYSLKNDNLAVSVLEERGPWTLITLPQPPDAREDLEDRLETAIKSANSSVAIPRSFGMILSDYDITRKAQP